MRRVYRQIRAADILDGCKSELGSANSEGNQSAILAHKHEGNCDYILVDRDREQDLLPSKGICE